MVFSKFLLREKTLQLYTKNRLFSSSRLFVKWIDYIQLISKHVNLNIVQEKVVGR